MCLKRLIQITGKTIFFAEKFLKQKWDSNYAIPFSVLIITRLLVQSLSNVNSASYSTSYHRVVTDSEEAHHLNVCRN